MSYAKLVLRKVNRDGRSVTVKHYSEDTDILLEYLTAAIILEHIKERIDNVIRNTFTMIIPVFDHVLQVGDIIDIGGVDTEVDKVDEVTQADGSVVYYKARAICQQ